MDKFKKYPRLPRMVSITDPIVIRLMEKAIKDNKELSFEDVAEAMYNKYDIVR